jgi:hypothetical protein
VNLSKVSAWWSTLVVGLLCCAFAYWAVDANLGSVGATATSAPERDLPWELLGAVVAVFGGFLAIATETKDEKLPLGVAPQGLIAGAILVVGLIFTYAKAEHDRAEHEQQELQLNVQRGLLLAADGKATKILEDMKLVNSSLQRSDSAIRGSVAAVFDALGTTDHTGLRGQITRMSEAALTAEAIASQVTPKIASEIGAQAAPLIARQFALPSAKDIAGKITLPSSAEISRQIEVPSPAQIASALAAAHPPRMPELASALVAAGFKPPGAEDLILALKTSNAMPSRKDLAQAAASSLLAELLPALQANFGRELARTLAASPAACDALADYIRTEFPPEQTQRIVKRLGG